MSTNSAAPLWKPQTLWFLQSYYQNVYARATKERNDLQPYVDKAKEYDAMMNATIQLYTDMLHREKIQLYGAWTIVDEGLGGGTPEPECNSVWRSKMEALVAAERECADGYERKVMRKECEEAIDIAMVRPSILRDMVVRELQPQPDQNEE